MNKKGFTIIELVVTLAVLLVLIGGVVYISPRFIMRQKLKNNAWQVLNDIKEVQERARAQLERLRIEFDIDNGTYRYEKRKNAFESGSNENVVTKKLDLRINFKSIRIGNTTYGAGIATYMYDEWGAPKKVDNTDPGEILIIIETPSLKNSEGQNLSIEITVAPGTGALRMFGPK
ncbi:MAG: prepilin-type N-terminal cleavage/methylation domain-containing protein [Caldisericia bacterium]|jgi:prepilin-type N-terminal cleavage/methylation domain-containing protein|nr:prepilin-type N-terminal cleavage/methylation domain-containing protein [Caldisericia bacterium]